MPTFSTDLLIYGAIAVAFMVFNYIVQKLSTKARTEQAQDQPAEELMGESEGDALGDLEWGRAPGTVRPEYLAVNVTPRMVVPETSAGLVPSPVYGLHRSPHPVREGLRDAADLRQAMVLLTVLGPCRANQEPDGNGR